MMPPTPNSMLSTPRSSEMKLATIFLMFMGLNP